MEAFKFNTVLQEDGKLVLENLPAHKGEPVEVIVLLSKPFLIEASPSNLNGFKESEDPILGLIGLGAQGIDPDTYIRELRANWE